MKLKSGFILRKCGTAEIVVPVGENVEKYKNLMITVSGSGRLLWDKLTVGCTEEELVETLLAAYDVTREVVTADVTAFLTNLRKAELLDE